MTKNYAEMSIWLHGIRITDIFPPKWGNQGPDYVKLVTNLVFVSMSVLDFYIETQK